MKRAWSPDYFQWRALKERGSLDIPPTTPDLFSFVWDQVGLPIETQIDWQIKRNLLNLE
jgi:hypothetical protein